MHVVRLGCQGTTGGLARIMQHINNGVGRRLRSSTLPRLLVPDKFDGRVFQTIFKKYFIFTPVGVLTDDTTNDTVYIRWVP